MRERGESVAPRSYKSTMSKRAFSHQHSGCEAKSWFWRRCLRSRQAGCDRGGFTLIEVIVAAAILGLGLLAIVRVFPSGLAIAQRSEEFTRATLLARSIFEGLKADEVDFPVVTTLGRDALGNTVVVACPIPLPGNAYDDDGDWFFNYNSRQRGSAVDLNGNGKPDADYDGLPEPLHLQTNGVDDDGDGIVDDDGDGFIPRTSLPPGASSLGYGLSIILRADGNLLYDPEPYIDEEIANGIDDDGDGLIDEDCRLASVRTGRVRTAHRPVLAGDGVDNDGDGQVDEEIFDFLDKATINSAGQGGGSDGLVDEDCGLARFPWSPARFAPPDDDFSWQVFVGVVPDTDVPSVQEGNPFYVRALRGDLGDAVDNDGDGRIDEELLNGLDDDNDGLIDEDCIASPSAGWRRVEILITWGGDGEDEDGDTKSVRPESLSYRPRPGSVSLAYGPISWGIDEEARDGLDNDLDGRIDEDCYELSYKLVGYLPIKSDDNRASRRLLMSYQSQ